VTMSMLMSHVHVNVHVYMEMGLISLISLISLIRYGLRLSEMDTPRHGAGLRHGRALEPVRSNPFGLLCFDINSPSAAGW
jgi:hypothetical protein